MRTTLAVRKRVMDAFGFDEIEMWVPPKHPGLYLIHMRDGTPLKVGIGVDVRKRLMQHRRSPDSGLRLKSGGDRAIPDDVVCKRSILGKHLYYDEAIAPDYDLKTQAGRQQFLQDNCVVTVFLTDTKSDAREIERHYEASGAFRYVGRVHVRTDRRQAL